MSLIKERPILFSSEMIRAILDGRKTQTRRVMKPQPDLSEWRFTGETWEKYLGYPIGHDVPKSPYGSIGDLLWVRETFLDGEDYPCSPHYDSEKESRWTYKADCPPDQWENISWKPSIFMPRSASRITLKITNIRVEQIQQISRDDAKAEGIDDSTLIYKNGDERHNYRRSEIYQKFGKPYGKGDVKVADERDCFAYLWDSINAKRGFSWGSNPFVWVIEFERVEVKR
jgi:hypothetical protein